MPATPKQEKAMAMYAAIMEEVKIRFQCIEHAYQGQTGFPETIVQEFFYLQLRMICELVAYGCLIAHGDVPSVDRLHKDYAADRIINELEKLHPQFFPQPVEQIKTGQGAFQLNVLESGYLKKKEFVELYRQCGDRLHRGSVKKLLSPEKTIKVNMPKLAEYSMKLSVLLNHHILALSGGTSVLVCMLRNVDNQNRAQVVYGEARPTPSARG